MGVAVDLSPEARDLLSRPVPGVVATTFPDGRPHLTVVWFEFSDGRLWFNTAEGRVKPRNMRRDPRIAFLVVDPENQYRFVNFEGRANLTHEGAEDAINHLCQRYHGRPFELAEGEVRVTVNVEIDRVSEHGFQR
ncbi:MAG: PPOX class F420-dependent oxidoreductase [Candidatus Dormibacteria bacterium]